MNKFIILISLILISKQLYCQDTITSLDLIYKFTESNKKAFNSKTNKLYSGFLVEYNKEKIILLCYYFEGELKESKEFYSNGILFRIKHYQKSGIENGEYKEWDENGKIKIEGKFLDGERNGYWSYFNDGIISTIGTYENNVKVGIWKYFDKSHKLIKKEFYINGILQ
ncbi:MAG: toxin-antitoxin system YwqK family antitoxin [Bacteroidales bacterium]